VGNSGHSHVDRSLATGANGWRRGPPGTEDMRKASDSVVVVV
jgi:hypothetical protein